MKETQTMESFMQKYKQAGYDENGLAEVIKNMSDKTDLNCRLYNFIVNGKVNCPCPWPSECVHNRG